MSNKELPAGWRVSSRLIPMGQDCEYVYDVQHWETWKPEGFFAWLFNKKPITGWRHLNGFDREEFAYQWAWDTIKALEASK